MGFYSHLNQTRQVEQQFQDLAKNQNRLFESILAADEEGLRGTIAVLSRLRPLLGPLAEKDRSALLAAASPILHDLKAQHRITHLYFIEPDGTVFLRAHLPQRHGDKLKRATFRRAVETGRISTGLEMGPNLFLLRCVTPVYLNGRLIGYMEVAEEIEGIIQEMKDITGTDVSILFPASYFKTHHVEPSITYNGEFAVLYPTSRQTTAQLVNRFHDLLQRGLREFVVSRGDVDGESYVVALGPARDAFGDDVGILLSHRDVTPLYASVWRGVLTNLTVFLCVLILGNALLYLSLRKSLTLFHALRQHIQGVTRTWKLDSPLEVTTHDEIGELAEDLNRMEFEIGKLNGALERKIEALAAANQDLESFSYSLSHDLRLPLTRIYSSGQMLHDGCGVSGLDDTGRFLVENICKGSEEMEELIEAILLLSRITRKELSRERVNLGELTRELESEFCLSEPERKVTVASPAELDAEGDRQLLRVALKNLLENAWKFTRSTAEATVEVGVLEEEERKIFFVRDNGVGFDMKEADKLFTPFKRLHDTREFPGTGIGLATVARIVQRHGGTIWGQGAKGKGATFFFTLS